MADRKFDTYMPGVSEQLEDFLNSIMSGRYLFFAIKVIVIINLHYLKSYLAMLTARAT